MPNRRRPRAGQRKPPRIPAPKPAPSQQPPATPASSVRAVPESTPKLLHIQDRLAVCRHLFRYLENVLGEQGSEDIKSVVTNVEEAALEEARNLKGYTDRCVAGIIELERNCLVSHPDSLQWYHHHDISASLAGYISSSAEDPIPTIEILLEPKLHPAWIHICEYCEILKAKLTNELTRVLTKSIEQRRVIREKGRSTANQVKDGAAGGTKKRKT